MRKSLKAAVEVLYRVPVIGYLLQILIGFFGLPQLRAKSRTLNAKCRKLKAESLRLNEQISVLSRGLNEQISALSRGLNEQISALGQEVKVKTEALSTGARDTSGDVAALKQHLPAFLNAAGSVGALGYQVSDLKRALEREVAKIADLGEQVAAQKAQVEGGASQIVTLSEQVAAQKAQVEGGASQIVTLSEQVATLTARPHTTAPTAPADALNHLAQRVDSLAAGQNQIWARLEFVRNEVLYELRHARAPSSETAAPVTTIRSPEKLTATGLRLNLGCGHVLREGYVNVDMRDLPGVDVVAPVDKLPVAVGSAAEIYSSHLLEHFESERLTKNLLPYWSKLLAPGGRFTAIVPDAHAMSLAYARGKYSFGDFREVFFGGQEYEGDYHLNMFTPDSLLSILKAAGFADLKVIEAGRRNGKCFEFEITGIRA